MYANIVIMLNISHRSVELSECPLDNSMFRICISSYVMYFEFTTDSYFILCNVAHFKMNYSCSSVYMYLS